MRVERTNDKALVESVFFHPEIKPLLFENGESDIPINDALVYLEPRESVFADGAAQDRLLGIVMFIPVNSVTWNPHIAILPEHRGRGTEVMKASLAWMFKNTNCEKVVAYPPVFNKPMIRVFEKCGFRMEGCSPKSFLWHGIYHARFLMGIEKG